MSKYLRSDEYVPSAPKNVGTIHINHANCPAGYDRKRRLYITRKEDGQVVAYCHHCGMSGSSGTGKRTLGRGSRNLASTVGTVEDHQAGEAAKASTTTGVQFPAKSSFSPEEWPKEVKDWYRGFGVTDNEARAYGFAFVLDGWPRHRLGLPCYDGGVLNGIQFRKILPDEGPKYLSRFSTTPVSSSAHSAGVSAGATEDNGRKYFDSEQVIRPSFYSPSGGSRAGILGNTCCVVEDILSAIRVGRHCRTIACLTSSMPENIMLRLAGSGYTRCVVWLDNDNVGVNRKARQIERKLGMVFNEVVFVSDKQDPKHYTDEEVRDVLTRTLP